MGALQSTLQSKLQSTQTPAWDGVLRVHDRRRASAKLGAMLVGDPCYKPVVLFVGPVATGKTVLMRALCALFGDRAHLVARPPDGCPEGAIAIIPEMRAGAPSLDDMNQLLGAGVAGVVAFGNETMACLDMLGGVDVTVVAMHDAIPADQRAAADAILAAIESERPLIEAALSNAYATFQ